MRSEAEYQKNLIVKIKDMFPGAMVFKNDPNLVQGIPDLLILFGTRWAALEVKASETASVRPNQTYYVSLLNDMSFAAFIYPENEMEILNAIQESFRT